LRRSFGIRRPRIVVCGLNPHAGEKGTIGGEELRHIEPGVRAARKGTDARIAGPLSPDALFYDAYEGRYDAEVCMYHDQGLIPLKMISRGHGVNVTLGCRSSAPPRPRHRLRYRAALCRGRGLHDGGDPNGRRDLAVTKKTCASALNSGNTSARIS